MKPDSNLLLLLGVCALSVLLVGALESGGLAGVTSPGPADLVHTKNGNGSSLNEVTVVVTTSGALTLSGATTFTNYTMTTVVTTSLPGTTYDLLGSAWLIPLLAVSLILIGALYIGLPSRRREVFDLEDEFHEMRAQEEAMAGASDYKARNEALLRYYALVRGVCSKAGITDTSTETPREFISRLSGVLKADLAEAESFSSMINEAMYGLEIPPERAAGLAGFMRGFAEKIRTLAVGT